MNVGQRTSRKIHFTISALALASLLACGGGGGGGGGAAQLSGVAAYGAPLSDATVTLTDVNGTTISKSTAADGSYTLNVTGLTAPFLLKASGSSGDAIREYTALVVSAPRAGETATANVTPLTHALVTMASSDGSNPNEFSDTTKLKNLDVNKLNAALSNLQTALRDVLSDANLPASFDPLTVSFKADRTSAADTLLDTIKVSVSDQGVALTNARVPVSDTGSSAGTTAATVTLMGTTAPASTLPRPTVSASDFKGLDSFAAEVNACLALNPADRAGKDSAGIYTFKAACDTISGFDKVNYKGFGYNFSQLWGKRLLEQIPASSKLLTPEFLLFQDDGNKALVRLTTTSSSGGRTYIETAVKTASGWKIIGNQRNFDATIAVKLLRQKDLSTNGATIPSTYNLSADKGKNVGHFDAYSSILYFIFNPSGPNGSNVYAVRVKGPGLPAAGIVLARSSSCGTYNYLVFYRNDGVLPSTGNSPTMATTGTGNGWILDVANFGSRYKGSDFYNQSRGLNPDGAPSTSTNNPMAAAAVDMKTIPDFPLYKWEVFTTDSGSTAAATFSSRITARPLAAAEGVKQPWANLAADALAYLDPSNATQSGALSAALLSWTLPTPTAPAVTSGYVSGSATDGQRTVMDQPVANLGDATLSLTTSTEIARNGNGEPCGTAQVPAFTATTGSRTVGLRQGTTSSGISLQQSYFHHGHLASGN